MTDQPPPRPKRKGNYAPGRTRLFEPEAQPKAPFTLEVIERVLEIISNPGLGSAMWFYLSFADDSGFLGGAILQADDFLSAVMEASVRGINPGGQVLGCELAGMSVLDKPQSLNRLLSKEEVFDFFADKGGAKRLGDLPPTTLFDLDPASRSDRVTKPRNR